MKEAGERFRVVTGDAEIEPARASAPGPRRYACSKCSDEDPHGLPFGDLVQVMTAVHEQDGKIVAGELWWACARCRSLKFFIRATHPKPR